ncbi:glucosamine-6-phosphate deaminase [Paenibacillus sp. HN-1]|uniref:glucosamine-6-phosphate deaminase n=1 Tax=Paenibacillus TaxID=44249 RepID=UPI001CA7F0C7|nr:MULTISPECIES: glucosamine-6-phosphate deaminase [Paenibacillus]MBY9078429.1 glucosamine-6-phosphate deaminase [Paenibacillus sp. CGMCC 1.18879]MBY9087919.1 glucosamine-6-phosphate deaminase [Paenibacillus sinensis]
MESVITVTRAEFDRRAAEEVGDFIRELPEAKIGFATGATTVGLHRELARMHREEGLDFGRIHSFNLDEYAGLSSRHPFSCRYRMEEQLFGIVNIPRRHIHFLNGEAVDPARECREYEALIDVLGGIDYQVVGIGTNGHIAFNEPGTPFHATAGVVDISGRTLEDKAYMFGGISGVPKQGITLGIKNVMHARRILLLAKGTEKCEIVKEALQGPVTPDIPASILQLHPRLTVIVDEEAGAGL